MVRSKKLRWLLKTFYILYVIIFIIANQYKLYIISFNLNLLQVKNKPHHGQHFCIYYRADVWSRTQKLIEAMKISRVKLMVATKKSKERLMEAMKMSKEGLMEA